MTSDTSYIQANLLEETDNIKQDVMSRNSICFFELIMTVDVEF